KRQYVGIGRLREIRQAGLRTKKSAAQIYAHHEIETLHGCLKRAAETDGAGVVDQDIDAAEMPDGLLDRPMDLVLEAYVDGQRQRMATRCFDLRRGGVDGAGQLGMRRVSLRGDHDVGSIAGRAQGNG